MKKVIVLDTEFIGLEKPFVYDLGYMVLDLEQKPIMALKLENSITKQIYDNAMLFKTAYYSNKREMYTKLLKGKQAKRRYWGHIMQRLQHDIDTYEIDAVLAYNASADSGAIKYTCEFLGIANPLETVQVIDLLPLVQTHICDTKEYQTFASEHGLVGDSGYIQTSVESVCKFIYNEPDFKEQHTALDDVVHESNLLNVVLTMGGKIESLKKRFIETTTINRLRIEIIDNGESKEYSFRYRTKKNYKKDNKIVLKK